MFGDVISKMLSTFICISQGEWYSCQGHFIQAYLETCGSFALVTEEDDECLIKSRLLSELADLSQALNENSVTFPLFIWVFILLLLFIYNLSSKDIAVCAKLISQRRYLWLNHYVVLRFGILTKLLPLVFWNKSKQHTCKFNTSNFYLCWDVIQFLDICVV